MLAPGDRRLLLDVLAPPPGRIFDQAIGTTYTLDLVALLRVPLAATALPWSDRSGETTNNPFALLAALRRNAQRITLFCHAGATAVPGGPVPLLTFLEDAVVPVTPHHPDATFHPKVWLLRFVSLEDPTDVSHRLVVLSRNLTFDRTWDTALVLDGRVRGRNKRVNRPLSEFVAALPRMARAAHSVLTPATTERVTLLADEVRRADWDLPEHFDEVAFWPLGHRAGTNNPVTDLQHLLVIAPFVSTDALEMLRAEVREDIRLIGRYDELGHLGAPALDALASVEVFDDASDVLDANEDAPGEAMAQGLSGLHAKLFVGERLRRAVVWTGSSNATLAGLGRNVELLVELRGSRKHHGIDAVRSTLTDAGLLAPFSRPEAPTAETPEGALERKRERLAHQLAISLTARATQQSDEAWRVVIEATAPPALGHSSAQLRPLALQQWRTLDLTTSPTCSFIVPAATSVTPFFALRVTERVADETHELEVTVRLPLEGAPPDRAEAVTAAFLDEPERLLRFILVLLADDGDASHLLEDLVGVLTGEDAPNGTARGGTTGHEGDIPLLEPMLKALHRDPARLDEIGDLLHDIEAVGGDTNILIPPDLRALWTTITELRATR
jgi:hypothetical protein